jgi:hypothetical protein
MLAKAGENAKVGGLAGKNELRVPLQPGIDGQPAET